MPQKPNFRHLQKSKCMRKVVGTKSIILLTFLLGWQVLSAQVAGHFGVRAEKLKVINEVVRLMNASAYDSAEALIISELLNQQNKLTPYEEYFFNSYEAEIMYYNALFDIGLASADKCLAIGKEMRNESDSNCVQGSELPLLLSLRLLLCAPFLGVCCCCCCCCWCAHAHSEARYSEREHTQTTQAAAASNGTTTSNKSKQQKCRKLLFSQNQ